MRIYPEIAIRELVANALIHQDFNLSGTGPLIEIFSDRMEITNPGIPLIDTLRFIDEPPQSRNEKLASIMRRVNICEERGSGIDKVIFNVEVFQLPAPDFRVTSNHTVAVLFGPREFSELMSGVGHGQFDDIFQQPEVSFMAFGIESMVRAAYVNGNMRISDTIVYEAYKTLYQIHFQGRQMEDNKLSELTKRMLEQYDTNSLAWKANLDEEIIGQVYLRLMISVKKMSGGRMGEYGYLNYLKNNLDERVGDEEFITEDKFGNKTNRRINGR